ncbi:MAG TPA: hypothetical protein PLF09_03565, partial [Thiotrichales bacterium]|nr:hypothetical protein [Thiotrichales bacterium]
AAVVLVPSSVGVEEQPANTKPAAAIANKLNLVMIRPLKNNQKNQQYNSVAIAYLKCCEKTTRK